MKIGVAGEIDGLEPRVAATPDTVKKFVALGVEVAIEPGAGVKSGLLDADYAAAGAVVSADALKDADVVIKVKRPEAAELSRYKKGALVIAIMSCSAPAWWPSPRSSRCRPQSISRRPRWKSRARQTAGNR